MFLSFAVELDSLCREIEHNLEECQSQSSPTCSWRQRIERREEAWEVNRGAIFEHAVRKESLSRYNVLKDGCVNVYLLSTYFDILELFFVWEKGFYTLLRLFNISIVYGL